VVFLFDGLWVYFGTESPDMEKVKGGLVGFGILEFAFLLYYEKSVFVFDTNSQWMRWTRYRFFRWKSGQLPFSQISNAVLQTQMGDHSGTPSRRIVLLTTEGKLPLTITYQPDEVQETIAERIRALLKKPPETLVSDSLVEMVKQRRTIEAVRLLRHEEGFSLTEAKNFVDDIKKEISNGQE
jgi:hypothetical protein